MRNEHLTFLDGEALLDLYELTNALEEDRLPGVLVEAGCARGGSAIVLGRAKSPTRPLYVYDVFGLIPPPSEKDGADVHRRYHTIATGGAGADYYGYEDNLYEQVNETFRRYGLPSRDCNIHLVQGLYEDTIQLTEPVALAHIDCDWYESVLTCLTRIEPLLVPGGVLVIDDYYTWSGCRRAVDEYFAEKREAFDFRHAARLQIKRLPPHD